MGKPSQKRNTISRQVATAAAPYNLTQPSRVELNQEFPTGNLNILDLVLNWGGDLDLNTASAGTVVTDGEKLHLRDIYLDTDQHNALISGGMDGLMLDRINRVLNRSNPVSTTIGAATSGNPTFRASVRIPFAHERMYRPYDGALWMGKATMRMFAQFGIVTDFISGGTYTTENVRNNTIDITPNVLKDPMPATYDQQGKIVDFGEDGIFVPCFDVAKIPVLQSAPLQIPLPVRDRIYDRIFVFQRNAVTLAEMSNVIADTAKVSLVLNNENWTGPGTLWRDIQAENVMDFDLKALIPCMGVIDCGGLTGRINNMLSVIDPSNQQLTLTIDVTAQTNAALWIVIKSWKPIPLAARR